MSNKYLGYIAGHPSLVKSAEEGLAAQGQKEMIRNKPLIQPKEGVGAQSKKIGTIGMKPMAKSAQEDQSRHAALKTFMQQTAASAPAHLIGAGIGAALGKKYLGSAATKLNGVAQGAGRLLGRAGKAGAWAAGKSGLAHANMSGGALGSLVGLQAAGGVTDLAVLHHGFKQREQK